MGRAQVAAASLPVRLRFEEGPRQHATAMSQWQLCQLRGPGKTAIMAWRTVAATGGGGCPCRQVSLSDCGYSSPLHNINSRFIQYTFMPPLDVEDPGGGLSMLLSPRLKWQDAGRGSPGRRQWRRRRIYSCSWTMAALSLGSGWSAVAVWQCGLALNSKFCNCICIFISYSFSYLAFFTLH
jgi:hypothetical protein